MLFDLACSIFDLGVLYIYLKKMLGSKKEDIPGYLYVGSFILVETILFCLTIFFDIENSGLKVILTNIVSFGTTFLLTLFHNESMKHRLFVAVSFQVFAALAETLVFMIFSILPDSISESFFSDNNYGAFTSKMVLFILLNITIFIWNRKSKKYIGSFQYTILVLIMPFLSMLLLMIIPKKTDVSTPQAVLSLVGLSGILLANLTNYFLLENILKMNELNKERETLDKQILYQTSKYQQISTTYRDSRRLIHDTKKHFFFIQTCAEKEDYDSIIPYIKNAIQDIEHTHITTNTGNLVIDSFVSSHMSIAQQENIEFRTDIQSVSNNLPIIDYDFSIVLGNLLDNALNACRKIEVPAPRQILVVLFTTDLEFVIHISNTINHGETANPSKNSESLYHGYGTKNIANIVEKYCGVYTNYIEDGWYHAIISIPRINK